MRWLLVAAGALSLAGCANAERSASHLADGRPDCSTLTDGVVTVDVAAAGCVIESDRLVSVFTVEVCADGRQLAYNHYGWAIIGTPLTAYSGASGGLPDVPSDVLNRCARPA